MRAPQVLSLREFAEQTPRPGRTVVSIGNFDGVHAAHRRLLAIAREHAERANAEIAIVTFEPHPLAVLSPQRAPARLTTAAEREWLLCDAGADRVVTLASVPELLELAAEAFIGHVERALHPISFVEGAAFRFGRGRGGSVDTLRELGDRAGYDVIALNAIEAVVRGESVAVSSSTIRQALADGCLDDAACLLGRPHRIVGVVGSGAGRGRQIGFPTANLDSIRQMTPGYGVYAAFAQIETGEMRPAAVNIGPQPTFHQDMPRVEAHLLDFSADLRGRMLGLHLIARLREQQRFAGVEELVAQLRKDVAETGLRLGNAKTPQAFPL